MNPEILDKFSTHLKNALVRAYALAQELRQPAIEPAHLLFALSAQKGSISWGIQISCSGTTPPDWRRRAALSCWTMSRRAESAPRRDSACARNTTARQWSRG